MMYSVQTQFYLLDARSGSVNEETVLNQLEQYRERLINDAEYEGFLKIYTPDGIPFVAEDSLPALVKNFCFLAIPDLVASRSFVYHYHSHYGQVRLDPEGDLIRVSGDENTPLLVDRTAFIHSIYHCGLRFVELLELIQIDTDSSDLDNLVDFLNQYREIAHAALVSI